MPEMTIEFADSAILLAPIGYTNGNIDYADIAFCSVQWLLDASA